MCDAQPAQEIFRRSSYCFAVDPAFAHNTPSVRCVLRIALRAVVTALLNFVCATCVRVRGVSPTADRCSYPIPEFGAHYTAGVRVFRHGADREYAFMAAPVDLDFVAVAAYRGAHRMRCKTSTLRVHMHARVGDVLLVCEGHRVH